MTYGGDLTGRPNRKEVAAAPVVDVVSRYEFNSEFLLEVGLGEVVFYVGKVFSMHRPTGYTGYTRFSLEFASELMS